MPTLKYTVKYINKLHILFFALDQHLKSSAVIRGAICQKTEVKLTPQNWGVKISKKGKKNILLIYAPLVRGGTTPSI